MTATPAGINAFKPTMPYFLIMRHANLALLSLKVPPISLKNMGVLILKRGPASGHRSNPLFKSWFYQGATPWGWPGGWPGAMAIPFFKMGWTLIFLKNGAVLYV
jgi:hypothetical protein